MVTRQITLGITPHQVIFIRRIFLCSLKSKVRTGLSRRLYLKLAKSLEVWILSLLPSQTVSSFASSEAISVVLTVNEILIGGNSV